MSNDNIQQKLPELRLVESYIEVLSSVVSFMSVNIAFPMFTGNLFLRYEDLRDAVDNFRIEFINQLKFKNYE